MNILALSPHTDDAELGAGGTLARFVEEGAHVRIVAFGTGDRLEGATDVEMRASMAVLEISNWALCDGFPSRFYYVERDALLQRLKRERDEFKPDLVLCPSPSDLHQDHQAVTIEALRAFKYVATIWAYEIPWNYVSRPFGATAFVALKQEHIERKIKALACYVSQKWRLYMGAEFVSGLARARGIQIMAEFAEAFEVLREIR